MNAQNKLKIIAITIISFLTLVSTKLNAQELPERTKALRTCFDEFRFGDRKKALEPCKRALELGEIVTNYALGNLYFERKEFKKSFSHFSAACEKLNYDFFYSPFKNFSCYEVARSYEKGIGVEKDLKKYIDFLEKACRFENPQACAEAGAHYETGQIIKQNYDLAFYYYKRTIIFSNIENLEHHTQVFLRFENNNDLIKFANERIKVVLPNISPQILPH